MFSANLSLSLRQLCEIYDLSYEQASERCGCSSRYFGNLVRKTSCPSLNILEGICCGFQVTPNDLVRVAPVGSSPLLLYRLPMQVREVRHFHFPTGDTAFPVCPKCGAILEREYQAYCDRCGQCLAWHDYGSNVVVHRP